MAFWRRRSDADFRDEIETHLALEAERLASHRGLSEADARLAARRRFGNVTSAEERFHDDQRWLWLERWGQHLRHALRAIRRQPGFALAAILTLGLGIGFNTAIFTVFYALGFRALPVRDADRLVNVYHVLRESRRVHGHASMISHDEYVAYQRAIDSQTARGASALTDAAVYADVGVTWAAERAVAMRGQYASCTYFATLRVQLALGRGFARDECARVGGAPVAVVSHAAWQRELGGDSAAIGRVVRLNQTAFTVIGVAEPGFRGLTVEPADVWVPVTMQLELDRGRMGDSLLVQDWSWLVMVARLAPGAGEAAARAQLEATARARDRLASRPNTDVVVTRGALLNFPEARKVGRIAIVLLGVLGALVIAMICANLMNLLLARGIARRREIGIRLAIGASRRRLVEQLLVESGVLALIGGVVGLGVALLLPDLVTRAVPVETQLQLAPDWRVFGFTTAVAIATAVFFGLVPALHATRIDLVAASKGGLGANAAGVRPARLRSVVVGVQVAGSALLLIVAALLVRSARHGATVELGFATDNVVTVGLNLESLGYDGTRARAVYDALTTRIAATPGVEAVTLATPLPLLGRRSDVLREEGAPEGRTINPSMLQATASVFATLEIPLVMGRGYGDAEVAAAGAGDLPLVISEATAAMLTPGASPLGRRLVMSGRPYRVVGVAANAHYTEVGSAVRPFVYVPATPERNRDLFVMARVSGSPAQLERMVPRWAAEIDPALIARTQRLSDRLDMALTPARLSSATAGTMGVLTLLLALIGIYGVVSYAVSQRSRDIAVRLALGATPQTVVRLMMRQGARAVVVGLVIGAAAALAIAKALRGILLGVSPLDPLSIGAALATLLLASAAAIYVPARRAASVDPARMLRTD